MTIREETERLEGQIFSPYAAFSARSLGRDIEEEPCDIRTVYQRDRDRILHSKSFRRLKHKTQVFLSPRGDHYRTRLTHTLEVSQLSRTIARALRLNEDLADAIALGHDLGHSPFGHAGERALNEVCPLGFAHYEQSVRIVELLEKNGEGLNLTKEVRDGILNHTTKGSPFTLEGQIVRYCDKIAYINHDIDDAERAGILREEDIPAHFRDAMGYTTRQRLNTLIHDVIGNSLGKDKIQMSVGMESMIYDLRSFMFTHVYQNPLAKGEESKAITMVQMLYRYYCEHIDQMPAECIYLIHDRGEDERRVVCDYISGMTDQYATQKFSELMIPTAWQPD
ncbi:MAG: deoxyguanosinetriphosphate triphosphohydrolase [Lachnospiraceae bacterium]|nr:deoxyguanosinetriphosphate triphosphohydrolase [Lachnospiraceae bacterium]